MTSRIKSVLMLSEYEDGRVEVVELPEGAQITMEVRQYEPLFGEWYPHRYVYRQPTYTFTVNPGSGSGGHLVKWTRFERKPGRRLAWAVRRLISGGVS